MSTIPDTIPEVSPLPAALESLAETFRRGEAHGLTPLDDICVASSSDGHAVLYAETDVAFEWANWLRIRPVPNVATGEIKFLGEVGGVRWELRSVPDTPVAYVPTDWASAVHRTVALLPVPVPISVESSNV